MIDRDLVTRKLSLIIADLKRLEPLAAMAPEQYTKDPLNEALAERFLERIIGRMIDVNFHLITELGHAPPRDYFDSFVELGRLGALEPSFARVLAQSTGLRNRIAHEYDEIDEQKVHEGARFAVRDVPGYLAAIDAFVEANAPK